MNTGKTLFAQLVGFLPWPTFSRSVTHYGGDRGVRTLRCAEQFRIMAVVQLTCRESLRDIEVCVSVFPWAHFRTTKAAVKMHTLLELRGNIPIIHVSDDNLHDVHAFDLPMPEAGASYVMNRDNLDFARLHVLHLAGSFFDTRTTSNMDLHRVYSAPTDRNIGVIGDRTIALY